MKDGIKNMIGDLRHVKLFTRRYRSPKGKGEEWWRGVMNRYYNAEKRIDSCEHRWYVLQYEDGHLETTRLRVLQGGFFSGFSPAIYRGLVIPRLVDFATFAHVKDFWLAF